MTRTTDEAVRQLADRAAIQDLMLRYARGVDRKDLDLVASCFTPDASYEGALASGTIADALARLRDRMAHYERTMHFIGNQLIEINGDSASSETYAVAYHRLTEDGTARLFTVGVRYLDDLARDGEQWRIRRRVVRTDWQRSEVIESGGRGSENG
jgi:3-phenylpropionate/cinnamic acid dioxygenase small subunit